MDNLGKWCLSPIPLDLLLLNTTWVTSSRVKWIRTPDPVHTWLEVKNYFKILTIITSFWQRFKFLFNFLAEIQISCGYYQSSVAITERQIIHLVVIVLEDFFYYSSSKLIFLCSEFILCECKHVVQIFFLPSIKFFLIFRMSLSLDDLSQ